MMRICKVCSKKFVVTARVIGRRRVYCSKACRHRANHPFVVSKSRPCLQCGKLFTANAKGKFCSYHCRYTYRNRHIKKHTCVCVYCGMTFYSVYATSRYCSVRCQGLHIPVPVKTLVCVDCGTVFTFKGRTRKHRCHSCHKKWNARRSMLWQVKKNPKKVIGAGSGGNQWGKKNHMWLPPEKRKVRAKVSYRKRAIKFWGNRCIVVGCINPKVHVHHVDGDTANIKLTNLIPLCSVHHWYQHNKRKRSKAQRIERLFTIWPEGRIKIAELSENTGTPATRTEGCTAVQSGATHTSCNKDARGRDTER